MISLFCQGFLLEECLSAFFFRKNGLGIFPKTVCVQEAREIQIISEPEVPSMVTVRPFSISSAPV